jgi:hypothetical protein
VISTSFLTVIQRGASLAEVLTSVIRLIEAHSEGMYCSIFLLEKDGQHLRYAAAPNLTGSYRSATNGIAIGSQRWIVRHSRLS